jgi:Domain of unknown function (DUF892)
VEHYEISRYGTLKAWAEQLGLDDGVELLEETLDEEEATDEALTEIAKSTINQPAGPGGRIGAALPSRERGQFFGVLAVGLWPGPTKRRAGSRAVGLQESKINECALPDAMGALHVETCTRRDVLRTRSSVATHYTAAAPTSVPTAPVRAGQDLAIGR